MNSLLAAFANRRIFWVLLLGFSSGLPLALTGTTLQAWMTREGVDLAVIGAFSLVGLPYALKFLWAPLMDRFVPPFLGRRRGWMLVSQCALVVGLVAMASSEPAAHPQWVAVLALLVAFFSASQDVVVDAWRTEILEPAELGPGVGVHVLGYRVAMIVSGGLALMLVHRIPWSGVYLLMAAGMSVGIVASLFAPEPRLEVKPPVRLKDAVVDPFVEFLSRRGAVGILLFILLYKLDVVMTTGLATPFLMGVGFTEADIGAVFNVFGMIATIAGTLLGGMAVTRFGIKACLWVFGALQSVSTFSFLALTWLGKSYSLMVFAIGSENLCSGLGNAAYTAFLMSLCDRRFTATQYALLTSLMAVTRVVVIAPTGALAKGIGWEAYFLLSAAAAVPGLLLLLKYDRWTLGGKGA